MTAFELPAPRVGPTPRWVRVRAGDTWIADSRRALLLAWYGPGMLPTYCFPPEDVRTDLLTPAPVGAGGFVEEHDVRVGDEVFERAAQRFVGPPPDVAAVDGHWTFSWEVVAESYRPHALFETTLPTRWYLPPDDVRWELLEPSDTVTRCPYKGTARYWSVRAGGELHRDLVWSYPDPIPECPRIAGLVAFFNEKVNLVVDGVPEPRPQTPWS